MKNTDLEKIAAGLACEMANCGPLQKSKVGKGTHTYVFAYNIVKAKNIILKELIKLNKLTKHNRIVNEENQSIVDYDSV